MISTARAHRKFMLAFSVGSPITERKRIAVSTEPDHIGKTRSGCADIAQVPSGVQPAAAFEAV